MIFILYKNECFPLNKNLKDAVKRKTFVNETHNQTKYVEHLLVTD